jgi:hypothetical protein
MVFFKGHRIRLEVSSSNFPRFDRNPNTGKVIASEVNFISAKQTVRHRSEYPSRLVLPIIPAQYSEVPVTTGCRQTVSVLNSQLPVGRQTGNYPSGLR